MPKTIQLSKDERIIAVVPEFCAGPGWVNAPTWVYIADRNGTFRTQCIQPQERTPDLNAIFSISEAVNRKLFQSVPTKVVRKSTRRLQSKVKATA